MSRLQILTWVSGKVYYSEQNLNEGNNLVFMTERGLIKLEDQINSKEGFNQQACNSGYIFPLITVKNLDKSFMVKIHLRKMLEVLFAK